MIKDILNIKLLNIQESETKTSFSSTIITHIVALEALATNVAKQTYLVTQMYCFSSPPDHHFLAMFSRKNLDHDQSTDSGQEAGGWGSAVCGTLELSGSVGA
jgi:hypothetical protein